MKDRLRDFPPYSVLMSVYCKDLPEYLEEAIDSMARQSIVPQEIVLVEDGKLTDSLYSAICACQKRYPGLIRRVSLEKNVGLGEAMRIGVCECANEWIARMDADDISEPLRCEKELALALERGADIVGCDIEEFMGDVNTMTSKRLFPQEHEDLIRFSRRKSPFCHPAVMMKKSAILRAGNYRTVYYQEDYDLFVRMLESGSIGYTVKEILLHMRVSMEFYKRRGGVKYVSRLVSYNMELLKRHWTTPVDFIVRSGGNILFGLAPVSLRRWLYRRLLRK